MDRSIPKKCTGGRLPIIVSEEKLLPHYTHHQESTLDVRMLERNDPDTAGRGTPNSTKVFQNEKALNEGDSIVDSISVTSNLDDISISSSKHGPRSFANQNQNVAVTMDLTSWASPDNDDNDDGSNDIEKEQKSSIFGTCSNLVNSIVGAGIIGIPYAIKNSGLIVGIFLLILVAYLTGMFHVANPICHSYSSYQVLTNYHRTPMFVSY